MMPSPYELPDLYDAVFAEQAAEAVAFLRSILTPRSRVVSLGCGSGMVEAALAADGHEVLALDLSPRMLGAARHRSPHPRWMAARIEAIPLEGVRADAIISPLLSCAYVTGPGEQAWLAAWMGRNLAPGGRVVLELPVAWTPMRVQGVEERTPEGDFSFRFLDADGATPWSVRLHTELRVGKSVRQAPMAVFSPGGIRGFLGRGAGLGEIRFMAPWDSETVRDYPPHDCLRAVVMAELRRQTA